MDDTVLKMVAVNYAINEKRICNEDRVLKSLPTDRKVSLINHLVLFLTIVSMYCLNPLFLSFQNRMIVSGDAWLVPLINPSQFGRGGYSIFLFIRNHSAMGYSAVCDCGVS